MNIFKSFFYLLFAIDLFASVSISSTPVLPAKQNQVYDYALYGSSSTAISWSATALPSWLSIVDAKVTTLATGFNAPSAIAREDYFSPLYIADTQDNSIKKRESNGTLITVASGFNHPKGLAVSSGKIYVADTDNNRIRVIESNGTVRTLAGSTTAGDSDGVGSAAHFSTPVGICVDYSGNIYVADSGNNKIKKITSDGNVSTLAGSGVAGFADGNATTTRFNTPISVVVDYSLNLYVSDANNNRIRKIATDGNVTTIAGNGTASSVDGNATTATFNYPTGLAVDSSGNIYVSDSASQKIRKISSTGVVSTIAGSGEVGFRDGDAALALFSKPMGLLYDAERGELSIVDQNNNKIRKYKAQTSLFGTPTSTDVGVHDINITASDANTTAKQNFALRVLAANSVPIITSTALTSVQENTLYSYEPLATDRDGDFLKWETNTTLPSWLNLQDYWNTTTFSGSGTSGSNDGNATTASFKELFNGVIDTNGTMYVVDSANNKIRKIAPDGSVTTYAGTGDSGSTDGFRTSASFYTPRAIAIDYSHDLYIADNNYIRKINLDGYVSTIKDTAGNKISINGVYSMVVDDQKNIYLAESGTNSIIKVTSAGVKSTISSSFNQPKGIAIDYEGNLYVSDTGNHTIKKIDKYSNVTTIAGSGTAGKQDGNATTASFNLPSGLALDNVGNLYVADFWNSEIRKITPSGVVSTIGGDSTTGSQDGKAATFNVPRDLIWDKKGSLYIIDSGNQKIRKMSKKSLLSGTPTSSDRGVYDVNLTVSDDRGAIAVQNFNITVTGLNTAPIWIAIDTNTTNEDVNLDINLSNFVSDADNNTITFSNPLSLDISKVTVSLIDNILKVTPVNNFNGLADVNITASDGTFNVEKSITVQVDPVNDTPTIDTTFNDITINEDNGTTTYELNVSDIEGSDLNITVESNNTNILTVTPNWTNLVNQATWTDTLNPLDFNLTTVANANGVVRITIHVDDGDLNATKIFDVNVTAVDDAPTLNPIANFSIAEDTNDSNLTLHANDVEGNPITYTASSSNPSIATVAIDGVHLIVTKVPNVSGVVNIEVNASANGLTATQNFDVNIYALNDIIPPTITQIYDRYRLKNATSFSIPFTVSDNSNGSMSVEILPTTSSVLTYKLSTSPQGIDDLSTSTTISSGDTLYLIVSPKTDKLGAENINIQCQDNNGNSQNEDFRVVIEEQQYDDISAKETQSLYDTVASVTRTLDDESRYVVYTQSEANNTNIHTINYDRLEINATTLLKDIIVTDRNGTVSLSIQGSRFPDTLVFDAQLSNTETSDLFNRNAMPFTFTNPNAKSQKVYVKYPSEKLTVEDQDIYFSGDTSYSSLAEVVNNIFLQNSVSYRLLRSKNKSKILTLGESNTLIVRDENQTILDSHAGTWSIKTVEGYETLVVNPISSDFRQNFALVYDSSLHKIKYAEYYAAGDIYSHLVLNKVAKDELYFTLSPNPDKIEVVLKNGYTYISPRSSTVLCDSSVSYDFCDTNNTLNTLFVDSNIIAIFKYGQDWSYWDENTSYTYAIPKFSTLSPTEGFLVKTKDATSILMPYNKDANLTNDFTNLFGEGWTLMSNQQDQTVIQIANTIAIQGKSLVYILLLRDEQWYIYTVDGSVITDTVSMLTSDKVKKFEPFWVYFR